MKIYKDRTKTENMTIMKRIIIQMLKTNTIHIVKYYKIIQIWYLNAINVKKLQMKLIIQLTTIICIKEEETEKLKTVQTFTQVLHVMKKRDLKIEKI